MAGLAGSLFAHYITYIDPTSFVMWLTFFIFLIIMLGGLGNNLGALVATAVFVAFREGLRFVALPEGLNPAALAAADVRRAADRHHPFHAAWADPRAQDHLQARTEAMLRVEGLTKDFGGLRAVNQLLFSRSARAAIFGLIGPNGSGKTTVFNLITGFLQPTAGQVLLQGPGDHRAAALCDRPARHRPHVSDGARLPPHDRAGEPARWRRTSRRASGLLLGHPEHAAGAPAGTRKPRAGARDLLAVVGLDRSGQRVLRQPVVCRAEDGRDHAGPDDRSRPHPAGRAGFGHQPDPGQPILDYIRKLREERGKTFLVVEHDMRVIMNLCDCIAVLNYGEKIAEGTPAGDLGRSLGHRRLPGRVS